MPEPTLRALADHGSVGALVPADGGDAEQVLTRFAETGVDLDALAEQLQRDGAGSFAKSWHSLLEGIASRSDALKSASA